MGNSYDHGLELFLKHRVIDEIGFYRHSPYRVPPQASFSQEENRSGMKESEEIESYMLLTILSAESGKRRRKAT